MTAWEICPHDVIVFLAAKDPGRRFECRAADGDQITLRTWNADQSADTVHDRAELAALDPCPIAVVIMMNTPDPFANRRRHLPAVPDVTDAVTHLTRPVTDVTDAVTPSVTGRTCKCGCGKPVISTHPAARYATAACRVRANRRKT